MTLEGLKIRSYEEQRDRARVEELEQRCEVGPAERVFLFTDTLGDPISRIRNSPIYKMLVAELDGELVGVIQGSIKVATVRKPPMSPAKVGYILGLRVWSLYRRRGIGTKLVRQLEEWFVTNQVDYAYMATEKDNEASVHLFIDKLGFDKFRTPAILVNPVKCRAVRLTSDIKISKLKVEDAEILYQKFMSATEFFPHDIDNILRNKLNLGTWVAYPRTEKWGEFGPNGLELPKRWAMVSVWNSGELFRLRLGNAPLSCVIYARGSRWLDRVCPCLEVPTIPDFFNPFGFYFMYGVHREGPSSGKLVRALCHLVHNMATKSKDCRAVVTEVGGCDALRLHIPHSKLLSCPEDLWCIKALNRDASGTSLHELTKTPPTRALFVDPREV